MTKVGGWFVTTGAVLAFGGSMLFWSVAPASECSTPHGLNVWLRVPPFALFVAASCYIAVRGTVGQRLLVLLASSAILLAYILVLSEALQMVITTEISCAAAGQR